MCKLVTHNPAQTRELGYAIGRNLAPPSLLALVGNLGSGKTCLAQGILRGIGITDPYLTSPSYVLVQEYREQQRGIRVYHMDLYRLEQLQQVEDLGFDEYVGSQAVGIIEWADKIGELLPREYLSIEISAVGPQEREIKFIPHGSRYEKLTSQILSNE